MTRTPMPWRRTAPIAAALALTACGSATPASSAGSTETPSASALALATLPAGAAGSSTSAGSAPSGGASSSSAATPAAAATAPPAATSSPPAHTPTPRPPTPQATPAPTHAVTPPPTQAPPCATVDASDFTFSPTTTTVAAGCTVVMQDAGGYHTFTSDTGAFDSGQMNPGQTYRFVFATPGTYSFHCANHAQMHATIQVS